MDSKARRAGAVAGAILAGALAGAAAAEGPRVIGFDKDKVGEKPAGFEFGRTGRGPEGKWVVVADESAPSKPNVLAQTDADDTDYRFPVAVVSDSSARDLKLSVRFKAVSGEVDRAGGLVWRYKDENNYYICRANALENNFRLYRVIGGSRKQFAGANLEVTSGQWHTIAVENRGNKFSCYYDGKLAFEAEDDKIQDAGKVGVWTKADSVTHFDDLTFEALNGKAGP